MRTLIGKTRNGISVYVDPEKSHAATHLSANAGLAEIVAEALAQTSVDDDNVYRDMDMEKVVGESDLVETSEPDEIIYAKRLNRDNYTRFVMNRQPEPTSYVTFVLKKDHNDYELVSTWAGRVVPQFPGDKLETPESRAFWRSHALAWGKQPIQENSVIKTWPWGD